MKQVLVCIPTRNRADFLKRTVQSILDQSFKDFRALVSDDASEPSVAAQVRDFLCGLDPRLSYVYHDTNLKEFDHGRFMVSQCQEEFFAILHDDDLWEPAFLERAVDVLTAHPDCALVTTAQYIIDDRGNRREDMTASYHRKMGRDGHREGPMSILEPLFGSSFFTFSSTLFRTEALSRSSFVDPEWRGNGLIDLNVFLRLGERGERAYYLPEYLAAYRIHEVRLSVTEYSEGLNGRLLEVFMGMLERRRFSGRPELERRRHLAASYHNYAIVSYFRQDWKKMYRYVGKCLLENPVSLKNWAFAGFIVFFPFLIGPVFRGKVIV